VRAGEEEEEEGTHEVVVMAGEGGREKEEEEEEEEKLPRQMMRERAVATGTLNTGVNSSSAMVAQCSWAARLTP
jgi:hypothetical protein